MQEIQKFDASTLDKVVADLWKGGLTREARKESCRASSQHYELYSGEELLDDELYFFSRLISDVIY